MIRDFPGCFDFSCDIGCVGIEGDHVVDDIICLAGWLADVVVSK